VANLNRTFKEIQDAVKTEMQLDPGLISDLERQTFINDALADLGSLSLFEKYATLTIVDGKAYLPDDLVAIIDVKFDNRYLIPVKRMITMDSDKPIGYTLNYTTIEVFPKIPTGSIDIYYAYRPLSLVNDEDKPDIPNGFDKMLVDWAVGHAHRKNGNIGLYREYVGAYNESKMMLMAELTRRLNSRVVMQHNSEYMEMPTTPWDFV
jgi:hypothetical protein